jgi:cell fate (sporulation/competence/biofilm development) regulator YmcA (YheA/YmcA/DUF963 family)
MEFYNFEIVDDDLIFKQKETAIKLPDNLFTMIKEIKTYKKQILYYLKKPKEILRDIIAVDLETSALKFTEGKIKLIAVHGVTISKVTPN